MERFWLWPPQLGPCRKPASICCWPNRYISLNFGFRPSTFCVPLVLDCSILFYVLPASRMESLIFPFPDRCQQYCGFLEQVWPGTSQSTMLLLVLIWLLLMLILQKDYRSWDVGACGTWSSRTVGLLRVMEELWTVKSVLRINLLHYICYGMLHSFGFANWLILLAKDMSPRTSLLFAEVPLRRWKERRLISVFHLLRSCSNM